MTFKHVLLFSSPTWLGSNSIPAQRASNNVLRNISLLPSDISYSEFVDTNITTLSSHYAQTMDGTIQGLLYVPDLDPKDPCQLLLDETVPVNVTRQGDLPPTDYNLIALIPWLNTTCTQAFLSSARRDPLKAMIIYNPGSGSTKPPHSDSPFWDMGDQGAWRKNSLFAIYAITGDLGEEMMYQLSQYSGNVTSVPYSDNISAIYDPGELDYVRIWTQLTVKTESPLPSFWILILAIMFGVTLIAVATTLSLQYFQSRRRAALKKRVLDDGLDLETLGIHRLSVPRKHIASFPLFTYDYEPPLTTPLPSSGRTRISTASLTVSSFERFSEVATDYQPSCVICLDDYQSRVTTIRELPCGHIFHPRCIDEYLHEVSSLCPLCKTSMLPPRYCPKITNEMVRRERATRKLRTKKRESSPETERD